MRDVGGAGERWREPASRAALALRFERRDLVCFSPRLIAVGDSARVRRDERRRGEALIKRTRAILDAAEQELAKMSAEDADAPDDGNDD